MKYAVVRDASYGFRPERNTLARITEEARSFSSPRVNRHIGEIVTIISVNNEGFNGIVAYVRLNEADEYGEYLHISTGALTSALHI